VSNANKALVFGNLVNRDYEGEISAFGQVVKINELADLSVSNYTEDTNITYSKLTGASRDLIIDQQKYVAYTVDDVLLAQAKPAFVAKASERASYALADTIDQAIAAKYTEAGIATSNLGTSGTSLSLYATHLTGTSSLNGFLSAVNRYMDEANVPSVGRWMVIPPWLHQYMNFAQLVDNVAKGGTRPVLGGLGGGTGYIGNILGINFFVSNNVSTNGTTQWRCMFGTNGAISFAGQIVKTEMGRHENKFGDWVRMLYVYGIKVVRPNMLGVAYVDDGGLST